MNVYLLWDGTYEDRHIVGIYTTLESAKAAHQGHEPEWRDSWTGSWACYWNVPAIPPDPAPLTFETLSIPVVEGVATLPDGRTVATSSPYVVVPVLPSGWIVGPFGTPAQSCDYEIEQRTLIG
jgi:hypothetical protein